MENFFTDTYIGWLCRQIVLILPPFSGAPHGIEMAALEANGGMKLATAGFKRETQWSRKYGEQVKRRSVELKGLSRRRKGNLKKIIGRRGARNERGGKGH